MHCAIGSCLVYLLSSWRKKGFTYICPPFCGTVNERDHCLILTSVRLLYRYSSSLLCQQPRSRKNCCHGKICCQVLLKRLISSYPCNDWECKEPKRIFISPRSIKKCCQHLLSHIEEKIISSNPCRGMECKEPIKIYSSPRNRKKCCYHKTCQVLSKS